MLTTLMNSTNGTWCRGSNASCVLARRRGRSSSCKAREKGRKRQWTVEWHGAWSHCFSIASLFYWLFGFCVGRRQKFAGVLHFPGLAGGLVGRNAGDRGRWARVDDIEHTKRETAIDMELE